MKPDRFRVGLIFSPTGLRTTGVVSGDYGEGQEFLAKIQPLVDAFMGKVIRPEKLPTDKRLRVILEWPGDDLDILPVILPQGGSLERDEEIRKHLLEKLGP